MSRKDRQNMLFLFLICLLLVLLTWKQNTLFGSVTDWINQHSVFPEYFRNHFYETGDFFPDFAFPIGSGQNIYNFAYYGLYNPILLLSYCLPFMKMIDYIMISSIVTYMVSVFLFYKWLRKHQKKESIALFVTILFLSAAPFFFHFHRHFMFVNYMPFLLGGLFGIDRILEKGKHGLLIFSTFCMILTSFYYSVGGIATLLLYGLYCILKLEKKPIKEYLFLFWNILYPIFIAIILSAFFLLPTAYALLHSSKSVKPSYTWQQLLLPNWNLGNLLYGTYTMGYTALAFLSLIGLLFMKGKEKKILASCFFILLFFPLCLYILNGGLYLRGKVLIPFLPLMALTISIFLSDWQAKQIKVGFYMSILGGIHLFLWLMGYRVLNYYVDAVITIGCLLGMYFCSKKKLFYVTLSFVALLLVIRVNQTDQLVTRAQYQDIYSPDKIALVKEVLQEDPTFYRFTDLTDTVETTNVVYDPRYYQTTLYSSMDNAYYHNFYYGIFPSAMPPRNNLILSSTPNLGLQTFLGSKYILARKNTIVPAYYVMYKEKGDYRIYQNVYAFPIGYARTETFDAKRFESLPELEKVSVLLNSIVTETGEIKQSSMAFETVLKGTMEWGKYTKVEEENGIWKIEATQTDTATFHLTQPISNQMLMLTFDMLLSQKCSMGDTFITIQDIQNKLTCKEWIYHNKNYHFRYLISQKEPITELKITFSKGHFQIQNIQASVLDINMIETNYQRIQPWKVNSYKRDTLQGTISVLEDGYFTASIPYEKGFHIKVDGVETAYEIVNGGFLGFPIQKGNHRVSITFEAPYAKIGRWISIVSFFIYMILWKRKWIGSMFYVCKNRIFRSQIISK